jgi:hypothetical protein
MLPDAHDRVVIGPQEGAGMRDQFNGGVLPPVRREA